MIPETELLLMNIPHARYFCFLLATLIPGAGLAGAHLPTITPDEAGYSADQLETMHDVLEGFVDRGEYAGYVSLIARDGKIVDWEAYGVQDVESGREMRKDSIVRMYSMSKIITSVAVLMLMEDGKLLLTDPVEKFLPELAERKVYLSGDVDSMELTDAERPVTIKHLLTHTSGYYYHWEGSADPALVELMKRADMANSRSLTAFMEGVAELPLQDQPGTVFRYGISTDILGAVVEAVSGQPFEDFLQERLFGPLEMVDTAFEAPAEKQDRLALIHTVNEDGELAIDPGLAFHFPSGGAGIYSTAGDYARFAQMLLNGGELDGVRILGPKTIDLMTKNHLSVLKEPNLFGAPGLGFGLGVRVVLDPSKRNTPESVGTYGWDGAATTTVQIDPKEGTVAILLTQHMPFNAGKIFDYWTNLHCAALVESRDASH